MDGVSTNDRGRGHASPGVLHADTVAVWINRAGAGSACGAPTWHCFRAMPSLGVPRPNLFIGDFTEPAATEQGHIAHKLLAQQVQRSLDTSLSTRAETV